MVLLVVVGLFNLLSILFFKSWAVPTYKPLSSLLFKTICKPVILLTEKLTVDNIFPWLSLNCNWLELSCNCVPTEPIKDDTGILSSNSLSALYNSKDKVEALYLKSVPSLSNEIKDTCDNWFPLLSYKVNVLFVGDQV